MKKQLLKRGIPGKKGRNLKHQEERRLFRGILYPVSQPPLPPQTTFLRLCKFYPILNNSLLVTKYTKRKNCKPKSSQCSRVLFLKAVTFWRPSWADSALCIKTSQFSVSSLQIVGEGAHRLSSFLSKSHPSTTCSLTFLLDAFLHSLRLSQVGTSWRHLWHPYFLN